MTAANPPAHRGPRDWEGAIRALTTPLPGSVPYENRRPIRVLGRYEGYELVEFLVSRCPFYNAEKWREVIGAGRLLLDGRPARPGDRVRSGSRLIHVVPGAVEPPINTAIRIIHDDEDLLVLDKPAPLPIHPGGRFNRNTLIRILNAIDPELRSAHRLDVDTTGCLVLAKSRRATDALRRQFEEGSVQKVYWARVSPAPPEDRFRCSLPISRGPAPGRRAYREIRSDGLPSLTEFVCERRFDDGSALLDVRPRTGRTNQIRLHLAALGTPVVGDRMYGGALPQPPREETLCLRARSIELRHPGSGARLRFEAGAPDWSRLEDLTATGPAAG